MRRIVLLPTPFTPTSAARSPGADGEAHVEEQRVAPGRRVLEIGDRDRGDASACAGRLRAEDRTPDAGGIEADRRGRAALTFRTSGEAHTTCTLRRSSWRLSRLGRHQSSHPEQWRATRRRGRTRLLQQWAAIARPRTGPPDGEPTSHAGGVEAAVDVDDLAGGRREPVRLSRATRPWRPARSR